MKKAFIYTVILLIALTACNKLEPDQVKINDGILKGTIEVGVTVFKGVPFAAPPLGDLHWKAPQPVHKWEGVKLSTPSLDMLHLMVRMWGMFL